MSKQDVIETEGSEDGSTPKRNVYGRASKPPPGVGPHFR